MAGATGADPTPWTNLGLQTLGNTDSTKIAVQNIAYLLETNFQNATDDPNFAKRTSGQKKMVHTSWPKVNPPYPIFVVSLDSSFGRGTGKGHARRIIDVVITTVSSKVFEVDQLAGKCLSMMFADANRESLVTKNQTWHSTNYLFSEVGTQQDPTRDDIFINIQTWRFFAQLNS